MSFRMAVAGKGGTGKTTLAALVVRALIEREKGAVLAVDADPNASLGLLMGLEAEATLADVREDGNQIGRKSTTGMSKHAAIEYALQTAVCEGRGYDLVTMGRPEGPGCYCYVNNLLRGFLDNLADSYPWVVLDNEAGMEHLSRRTTNNVQRLLIVYEPTAIGIKTAQRLKDLSRQLPIALDSTLYVANRVPPAGLSPDALQRIEAAGVRPDLEVPADEEVSRVAVAGESVFALPETCPALVAVRAALQRWDASEAADGSGPGADTTMSASP